METGGIWEGCSVVDVDRAGGCLLKKQDYREVIGRSQRGYLLVRMGKMIKIDFKSEEEGRMWDVADRKKDGTEEIVKDALRWGA